MSAGCTLRMEPNRIDTPGIRMRRAGSRVDAEKQHPQTEREAEHHADLHAAAPRALAEGSQAQGREKGEDDHADERRLAEQGGACRAGKADVHKGFRRERLHAKNQEIADQCRHRGGRGASQECLLEHVRDEQVEHHAASRPIGESSRTGR